ncbi:hypothetical protein P5487_014705 [Bacillus amyloliquefaciens]|uniref:hypothetical protein n=1 Tax=Bacillus amyloliquefaciens group TaxID=1938374 RepID=UPI0005EEE549|nr:MULTISPECIES: hypothetical protein [Bacillus amyloliquefaciens group]AXY37987.1 hypothetical protein D3C60_09580 [Bacillus velezensis]MDH3087684.1 hypothetical protein [Bacillus amyloliquefaciens]
MQINRHTVGTNVASLGAEVQTNEQRIEEMTNHFNYFRGKMFEEENNFIETYDDGKPKKRFKIFTAMTIPVCVELDANDRKDAIEELVETGEMGVNFPHIMLDMGGGKTVIPTITDNVFYIDEKATVVEADEVE